MRLLACRELDLTTVRYECILPSKTNRDKCRTDIFKVNACPTDGIKAEVAEFWSKVESVLLLLLVWTKRGTYCFSCHQKNRLVLHSGQSSGFIRHSSSRPQTISTWFNWPSNNEN